LRFWQRADFFLENDSKPPMRAKKTHQANLRAAKLLKSGWSTKRLVEVTADQIELYLRDRLRQRFAAKRLLGTESAGH
jgi:hypothetical protein